MLRTVKALNQAAKALPNGLCLRWVKAHVNHRGNEAADAAARAGAEGAGTLPCQFHGDLPLRPLSSIKADISKIMFKEWNNRWVKNPFNQAKAKVTKLWFPEINPKKSYQIFQNRSRYDLSEFVHCMTGTNHLAYFDKKCKTTDFREFTFFVKFLTQRKQQNISSLHVKNLVS